MNIKKNLYLLIIAFIVSCSPTTQSNEDVTPDGLTEVKNMMH